MPAKKRNRKKTVTKQLWRGGTIKLQIMIWKNIYEQKKKTFTTLFIYIQNVLIRNTAMLFERQTDKIIKVLSALGSNTK